MTRETYYLALFALLQTLAPTSFTVVTRKLILPQNVNPAEFPRLTMVVGNQGSKPVYGNDAQHTLGAQLFIYVKNPNDKESADPLLNAAIDAVEQALKPFPGSPAQSLGGIVQHCWIEGTAEIFSGSNSQFAAAIVPVKILVP